MCLPFCFIGKELYLRQKNHRDRMGTMFLNLLQLALREGQSEETRYIHICLIPETVG